MATTADTATADNNTLDFSRAWGYAQVAQYLGTTQEEVKVQMDDPNFPKPRWLGPRRPRWAPSVIVAWLAEGGPTMAPPHNERRRRTTNHRRVVERV